jgi:hypothetical protein
MMDGGWFRCYTCVRTDPKLVLLPPAQRWVWIALLCLAKESPVPGTLLLSNRIPLTMEALPSLIGVPAREVRRALEAFVRTEMLVCTDGVWRILHWQQRQFSSDRSAERVRIHRQRETESMQQLCNVTVTPMKQLCNVTVTPPETESDTDTDTDTENERKKSTKKERAAASTDADPFQTEMFERFWQAYPKHRAKSYAQRMWQARMKERIEPELLVRCATHYAQSTDREGTGEQFLLHASTFLGPHRRYLDYVEPPPQQPERRSICEARDDRELDSPREDFNRYSF